MLICKSNQFNYRFFLVLNCKSINLALRITKQSNWMTGDQSKHEQETLLKIFTFYVNKRLSFVPFQAWSLYWAEPADRSDFRTLVLNNRQPIGRFQCNWIWFTINLTNESQFNWLCNNSAATACCRIPFHSFDSILSGCDLVAESSVQCWWLLELCCIQCNCQLFPVDTMRTIVNRCLFSVLIVSNGCCVYTSSIVSALVAAACFALAKCNKHRTC